MNICFISQEFPPETGWGGIGTYVYNISCGLAEIGHHVNVITRATTTDGILTFYEGRLRIHRVWHKDYPLFRKQPFAHFKLYQMFEHILDRPLGWGYGAYKHLQCLHQEIPINIVEVAEHNADGFFYALRRWIPRRNRGFEGNNASRLIVKLHLPMMAYYRLNGFPVTYDIRMLNRLERWTTCHADGITCPSQKLAKMVSDLWQIPYDQITILPHPIDDDLFVPNLSAQQDEAIILFVGRLEQQKGVDVLVDAFKEVLQDCPNAKLLLAGEDRISNVNGIETSFKAQLKQKLASYQIESSVKFIGKVERSLLPQYYQASRVCVVPSDFESFSNVCMEAMACGRPVIATNSGAIPEYMEHRKHGILIPPQNPKILAESLVYLLKNKESAEELGKEARKCIETRYSRHVIAYKTAQIYEHSLAH